MYDCTMCNKSVKRRQVAPTKPALDKNKRTIVHHDQTMRKTKRNQQPSRYWTKRPSLPTRHRITNTDEYTIMGRPSINNVTTQTAIYNTQTTATQPVPIQIQLRR